ncbi:capsule biosynthesis protein [Vandammella animalimorsus]|uniref:Capsule biosynthesis protein CapA n=1 Tax=Vandammella animalimorsus TaxID=2029117 RepID=A0A2A2ADJ5_9BURK|nr:capsular biosynthesis protein [Vandammella animalimorsus]PAT36620.1 capsule biosynthesis protein CapA [Vandammella animalimorsus]
MKRSFLFLQGPCTPFFARLAAGLRGLGHAVHRLNFCAGDALYWASQGPAQRFVRSPGGELDAELRATLAALYQRHGITDQVLFGDQRQVHLPAVAQARAQGVRTHVFEEGYFRPAWITLEREGVNARSLLPRDIRWYQEAGPHLPEPVPQAFAAPFYKRATHDVAYHLAGLLNPLCFPRYRTHASVSAPLEYAGYLRRFALLRRIGAHERRRALAIANGAAPYFLLPLQLNGDAQIRAHSRFTHMGQVIELVLQSFAAHAPPQARLVIKNHPLDMGLMPYGRLISQAARRLDLQERVDYLEDGDLQTLARQARGVVTVNSTAGLVALEQGAPTLTLSDPIYNLPGLTSQMPLDAFWREAAPPDASLFASFRRCVVHATQINGGFYCTHGMSLAVAHSLPRLLAQQSPLEQLL